MTKTTDGFPVANPTKSYWQDEASDSPLHNCGRDAELPQDVVDVAVIGSGISGAVAAYMLQHNGDLTSKQNDEQKKPSIVMLEARSACSGATGRNGGHCRPDVFAGFAKYTPIVGKEQAHKVLLNEWETFEFTEQLALSENLDCDWWRGKTLSVFCDKELNEAARKTMSSYAEYAGGLKPGVRFVDDQREAKEISRVSDALGAAVWPAGSLHPIRFVHGLLQRCLELGNFSLFTHTPVEKLSRQDNGGQGGNDEKVWHVQTSRGIVRARKVLLATNGYSNILLPALKDFLLPHRAQCSAVTPPDNFARAMALTSTCAIVKGVGDYEYLTQQPSTGGPNAPKGIGGRAGSSAFILGGGHPYAPRDEQIGTMDDSITSDSITRHLDGYGEHTFVDWAPKTGHLRNIWTGIQGYTKDSLPVVGSHYETEHEGLYLCLGHHGHGMARAATCARGVARLMLAANDDGAIDDAAWERKTSLPSCYRWTRARATRQDVDCLGDF